MKITEEKLNSIHEKLKNAEYSMYADLLSSYLVNCDDKENWIIGFVGDDLVGKSTIINVILENELLPTSVIPSMAEVTLKYGEQEKILTSTGEAEKRTLAELIEADNFVEVITSNSFLKENSLVIKEFHGIINKQKLSNITLMSEVYKCDAIVMVMSAEHLFSESECIFIENYIQYVGANRLFLVINKLSFLAESDIENVLEYVQRQIAGKFSDIKWTIYNNLNRTTPLIERYGNKDIRDEMLLLLDMDKEQKNNFLRNLLQYIKEQLQTDVDALKKAQIKGLDEVKSENEKLAEKKKLELASIEEALIEFKQRKNMSVSQVDEFLKKQFDFILKELVNEFEDSPNKYVWYEKELESNWKKVVAVASERTDKFALETILKDIEWINEVLQTKLGLCPESLQISADNIKKNEKMAPYDLYKKYAPIGVGGLVIIGYCLLRITGAVIGLCGGVIACSYLGLKDKVQNEDIKRELSSKIKEVSFEVRKISRKDIETIYDDMVIKFEREAKCIIDAKYKFIDSDNYVQKYKTDKIQEVINYMEE